MINASKEFKEKLKNGANVVNYADITLSDGTVLHLTYKDFMIGGCSIEDKTTDGKFGVGFVIGKTLTIKIANHDERFSQYDFYNSILRIYVAMAMDNGTIEKIRKGVYYATVPSTRGEIIEISAVDGMFLLDQDYSMNSLAYPATLQAIITNACLECGIPIGFRQFDNMNFVVNEKPETGTYRQIVSYACQIAGYNARIDNDGYMQLIWYNSALLEQYNYVGGNFKIYPHDTILDGGNFTDYSTNTIISGGTFNDAMPEHIFQVKSLDVHTDDVQITGVRVVGEDDKTVLFGEEGYLIEVKNPFANGKEQEVANYLGRRMVGMMFRPFSAQILNNPLYEPFEVVRVSDRKRNVYISILNSVSYKVGGYTQVACQAEDPRRNGSMYYSEAAAAVVEARRNTEKQLTTYDKAVQQMNQLAGNAMGFHTTYEEQADGSRITYLHDKPTLSGSKTIYKQTIDGFFISTDGGKTYTAGFDKNGNAVVNILYAIGIVADWIRGGTLTLGGDNNIDGSCVIYDANKNEIGRFDKDGIVTNSANITGGYINIYTDDQKNSRIVLRSGGGNYNYKMELYPFEMFLTSKNKSNNSLSSLILTTASAIFDSGTYSAHYGGSSIVFFENNTIKGEISSSQIKINGQIKNGGTTISDGLLSLGNGTSLGGASSTISGWNITPNQMKDISETIVIRKASNLINSRIKMGNLILQGGDAGSYSGQARVEVGSQMYLSDNGTTQLCKLKNLSVDGYLLANGSKSRLAKTKNYSNRLLYCYETTKPYFGDIGEASLDENGVCYIFIDDIFYETINTDCQYQVFLQKYGQGDVWVEERNLNYFIVKGSPYLKFGWELKARQSGYEMERLERFAQDEPEEAIDYEKEAQNYIDGYYKEVLNYEESY